MSFFIISDYGPNVDSQKNFAEGEVNLTYLLTGKITSKKIIFNQNHGAFSFMLADASRRLFSRVLKILDPVSARHIILPVLTSLFIIPMYYFVKKFFGAGVALVAVCALITFPDYFGHTFNNLKDIPLLIFFSLSIFSFAEWKFSNKLKYFYLFFVFLGLACSIKFYAFMVLPILFIWLKSIKFEETRTDIYKHVLFAALLAVFIVLLLYVPAVWGIENNYRIVHSIIGYFKFISTYRAKSVFSFLPVAQVLYRTPVVMLFFAISGFVLALWKFKREKIYLLLFSWMMIPVLVPCLPGVANYDSLRQFIVFLVPFSIFSAAGIKLVAELLELKFKLKKTLTIPVFSFILIFANTLGVILTHPCQTTFFNILAGGLRGAQEKMIRDSFDYWLNSYRQAGRWLDKNAKPNSTAYYIFDAAIAFEYREKILSFSIMRKDITTRYILTLDEITEPNSYVVFVPFHYLKEKRKYLSRRYGYSVVCKAKSQGGEIFTIYYKP